MQNQVKTAPNKFKTVLGGIKTWIKNAYIWTDKHVVVQCIIVAFLVNLVIEMLSRHSVIDAFEFLILNFIFFLFNTSVIFATLCIANFFKKRYAVLITVSTLWLILGITNFIIKFLRVTPFEANDFLILKTGFEIVFMYLNVFELIGIALLIIGLVTGFVFLFIKAKKHEINWKKTIISFVSAVLFVALSLTSLVLTGIAPKNFSNLVDAYNKYGFVYCFGSSIFNRGISKPAEYSQEYIDNILGSIGSVSSPDTEELPNIVFVQLESFIDVKYIKDLEFSEDPIPTFTELRENYTSGFLTVPSIGAGTANTEFEVMTGMRVFDFGTGEYPYKTILLKSTCESMAYIYKEYGYYSHAIHNNTGAFYDRYLVFPNLGFDRFNSLEYMENVEMNPIGWAKDTVLVESITGALNSTEDQKDYVHAISVQGHGRYPSEKIDDTQTITLTGMPEDYQYVNEMEYFANQMREMDEFIKELITELESYDEKTIVVFYGDHFPSLNIEDEHLDGCNVYQTEYVMWSNYEMEEADRDLDAYQLGAYVSYHLGVNNGIVNRIHQKYFDKPYDKYSDHLEAIEYDMLYGKDYVNHGKELYKPTDMKMGLYDTVFKEYEYNEDSNELVVKGENFNKNCMIFVNNKRQVTEFVSENELRTDTKLKDGDTICVVQMSNQWMIKLDYSNEIPYPYKEESPK